MTGTGSNRTQRYFGLTAWYIQTNAIRDTSQCDSKLLPIRYKIPCKAVRLRSRRGVLGFRVAKLIACIHWEIHRPPGFYWKKGEPRRRTFARTLGASAFVIRLKLRKMDVKVMAACRAHGRPCRPSSRRCYEVLAQIWPRATNRRDDCVAGADC